MRLVDANVLLYSVNTHADHHDQSRAWVNNALSGSTTVGFAWNVLLAFLRLATNPGMFPNPLSVDQATGCVDAWLAAPPAIVLQPTTDHGRILRNLLHDTGVGGNLVNDAHLAALAIEHKCVVVSYDNDFDRFEGVRRETPNG